MHKTSIFASSSAPRAALLGALLCLVACDSKNDTTAGSATDDATTTTESATDSGSSTVNAPTDPGTDASTAAETDGDCADHGSVDACCCFELIPGVRPTPPEVEVSCGGESLCPSVTLSCGGPDDYQSQEPCTSASDDAALDCVLEALAAKVPGSLRVELYNTEFPGYWADTLHFYVLGDGTVFHYAEGFLDFGGYVGAVEHRALKPASFFTDCLAADSVEAKTACLKDATAGDAVEACTEYVQYALSEV